MRRPWRSAAHCFAPGLLSLLFMVPRIPCPGMASPVVSWDLPHQSLTKKIPHRSAHSPVWLGKGLSWSSLFQRTLACASLTKTSKQTKTKPKQLPGETTSQNKPLLLYIAPGHTLFPLQRKVTDPGMVENLGLKTQQVEGRGSIYIFWEKRLSWSSNRFSFAFHFSSCKADENLPEDGYIKSIQ